MNIEQTIAAIKKIEPVIKSDDGAIIESNETNIAISSLLFNIRALRQWTTISLLVCTELSKGKFDRAKDYLLQTLDTAVEVICEKMKYVEYHENAITDLDIDNALHLQSEKYIRMAENKGWIIHVDLLNRQEQTRIEYYCFPDNVEYVDKPHENDPIRPTQKDPHCRLKVTPVRRLKKTPLADAN